MNSVLFRSPQLQSSFEKDGFVVIDLAGEKELDVLLAFYAGLRNAPMPGHGFQVSLDNEDAQFVQRVAETLIGIAGPLLERHFQDHQVFTASFVVKETNPAGIVPPHQDWTFVDETRYWSATVWCPLQDVGLENGALGLISGSHNWYDHVRPSPSPYYEPPFKDQLALLFPYIRLLELKAGQAVVFNNRTLHASPPNLSGRPRLGVGIGITHRDAGLRHYYLLPGNDPSLRPGDRLPGEDPSLIEGYAVERTFFYHYNNARLSSLYAAGRRPEDLRSIGSFPVSQRVYAGEELQRLAEGAGNRRDDGLWRHLSALPVFASLSPGPPEATPSVGPVQSKQPFWKVYTPKNVYREIRYRLTKKTIKTP